MYQYSILYSVICIIQVPSSQDRFVFGSGQPSGAPDLIVTSSNSGLQGQEGLDRTAMDIQVFARGGAEPAQQQNVPAFAAEEEEINIDESEEGGVSSIVSSSEQQGAARPGRARTAITWGTEGGGTTSSSPQRQAAAAVSRQTLGLGLPISIYFSFQARQQPRGSVRGVAPRGARGARTRGMINRRGQ